MKAVAERPPGLLHNSGYAPRASIVWRGFGRGPLADEVERIEVGTHPRHLDAPVHLDRAAGRPIPPRLELGGRAAAAGRAGSRPGRGRSRHAGWSR